jgi:hypothetical protein
MMKRIVPALVLASTLCAPAVAASLPSRASGLWQSTTTVTGPNGQPLPNAANVVTVSCVDELNDQKFFTSEQSDCSSLAISGGGGSYSIDGTCEGQGRLVKIHETLVYADAKNMQLTAVYAGKSGRMTVTSQLQWQGACLPGMQPGDEGNVSGGTFIKSDNINDSANQ